LKSVTGAVCSAVWAAYQIVAEYADRLEKLTEADKTQFESALCNLSKWIVASNDLVRSADLFRGHFKGPPKSIAGIHAASYHELGRAIAFRVEHAFDSEQRPKSLSLLRFDPSWLVTRIEDEAVRANRPPPGAADESARLRPPPKQRRRATKPRKPKALTSRQAEVIQIVGECKGNIAAAARRLGRNQKTVAESYKAAMAKIGKTVVRSKDKARLLPRDKRGQEIVSDSDERF
jgi:predicted DNA-binding protein (UPF0251 family)